MQAKEIRPFIPSDRYKESLVFYTALGFVQDDISDDLCILTLGECTFFLHAVESVRPEAGPMYQLIVTDIEQAYREVSSLAGVRYEELQTERWGRVFQMWGPSGELWQITELAR